MQRPFDSFCNSPLWDEQQSWNATDPDFSDCFQQTILIWVPVIILLLLSPIEVYFLLKRSDRRIPWTSLNTLKLFLGFVSLTVNLVELVTLTIINSREMVDPLSEIIAPGIQSIGLLLSLVFIIAEKRKGVQSSGVLFIYWLLLAISATVNFRTTFRRALDPEYYEDEIKFMANIILFPSVVGQLILSMFSDGPVYYQYEVIEKNKCPMESSSFLSKLLFTWFDGMIWKGFKRPIDHSDLWPLNYKYKASIVHRKFDLVRDKQIQSTIRNQRQFPSVVLTLFKTFGWQFIFVVLLKLMSDLLIFGNPLLLELLIKFISSNEPVWHGYFFAFTMFFVAVCLAVVLNQYNFKMKLLSIQIRTALVMAIYSKALKLSNKARNAATMGQIVNLMSVDSFIISDLVTDVPFLWSAPIQILISLYLIWDLLGPSTLAGVAVLLLMMPTNTIVIRISRKLQRKLMKIRDERIRMMNELLSGIKVLKLYAWEKSYYNFVTKIRNKELEVMKKMVYVRSTSMFLFQSTPILISIATFTTYTLVDSANILDAAKAFVSLSLFDVMRPSLISFPMVISRLIQALVSLQRINDFLASDELDCCSLASNTEHGIAIAVNDGTFSWGSDDSPVLQNINLQIPEGFLVAVVGPVGSGKSSLLSSILGELEKQSGIVSVQGSVAFVPQLAWIQNATLKNNVLFEKPYEKSFYDKVIQCCALEPDLKVLPCGDETEIGEKGINLSGGQKQRVSLARAVYNNADIYLLDDPLSAVDAHVGKELFENVIGPQGLLQNKTRVLVTHKVTILPKMDLIIVLNEGKCSESGTFKELVDRKGAFASFLLAYFNENEETDDKEFLEIKEEALSKIKGPVEESDSTQSRRPSTPKELVKPSKLPVPVIEGEKSSKPLKEDKAKIISKEHAETGEVSLSVYLYYAKSVGLIMALVCLMLMVLSEGCSVGSNLWLSDWSQDQPINGTQDPTLRDLRLGVYGALGISQALLALSFTIFITLGTLMASRILHNNMLSNILKCPMSFFETTPLGRILNRFSKDLQSADAAVPRVIRMLPVALLHAFSTLIVISVSTPAFIITIPVVTLLYYFLQKVYIASSRQLKRLESIRRSPTYSHFSETLAGITTIRAYKVQDNFLRQLEDKVDSHHCSLFARAASTIWIALRLEIIGNLVVLSAAIFAVLGKDTLNAGIVGLSVSYAIQLTRVLNGIIRSWSELETNIVSVERIKEYTELETEEPWELPYCCPPNDWPALGSIVFQDYSTRYRKGLDLVLHKVSCNILGGYKIGVVGRTGAGKSSLIQALFRIIEKAEGSILIDRVDVSQIGLHDLRSKLTIIPQDPVLFMGTLRVNLDPFTEYTDDQLWNALGHAHLKTFVSTQKEGLEYQISEGGENLSVGQRQLVCLARALLRKSKILVLDEATAAIDLETDELIQATIRKEFADCTVITIAHRLNTIMDSTKILVLEDGKVKEYDSPENLLQNKDSLFYSMAKDAGLV